MRGVFGRFASRVQVHGAAPVPAGTTGTAAAAEEEEGGEEEEAAVEEEARRRTVACFGTPFVYMPPG
jgi:hypothetical protein